MNIKDINQDAYRALDAPLNIKSLSSGSYSPVEAEAQKPSFLQRAGSVVDLIFGGGKVGEAIGTLAAKKGLTGLSEEERQYVDQGPTKGEVAGSALRSAALFTPVGRIAGAVSKGLAKTGLTTGAKLLGNIGAGGATGEVFDIATNLESGKTGAETLTPGLGTGIGAGLPLVPPAVKGAGRLVAESLGVSTGAGYGAIKELFKASAKGGVEKKAAIDALRGNTNPEQIVQEARDALSQIRNSRSTAYTRELAALKENTKSYDISPVVQAVKENLNKFGVTVSQGGTLDFSRSPIRFNTTAQNDITNVVEVMKDFGSKQGDRTVVGIDSLKRALGDLITPSSEARAFVTAVKDSTRKILSDVPGYDDMAEQYATKSKLISELQKTLSLGDKASIDSSFKKLTTVLRTNNEERRILVEELNAISDGKLVPMIAGQQMSEILPRGIARQIEGFGALGSIMAGFGAPLLKMAIFASPRVVGEMINALGIGARAGNYLLDVLGVKGVKLVSPGDRLLNTKAGQKVEQGVKDYIKNPRAGLSIEDVSKGIPKELEGLAQEARKYKTAEEFVKAKKPVYHGSPVPLKKFSNKKGGAFFTEEYADATGFAGTPDNVYEGYLDFKNPLVIDAKGRKWDDLNTKYGKSTQEVISKAQGDGYDGVVFKNVIDNVADDVEAGAPGTIYYAYQPENSFINESQLTDIWEKAVGKNKEAVAFKNFTDLSTKLLGKLEGRSTVSKQFIEDLTNSPDLKQPERDLFRSLLKDEPDTVNVKTFANKVKGELLPLTKTDKSNYGNTYNITRYENITLPDELRGPVADYQERIYSSPIKTSAGDVHYNSLGKDDYFAHTRIEDLPKEFSRSDLYKSGRNYSASEMRELENAASQGGTTRRVIEIQSDLFQKGRLEQEKKDIFRFAQNDDESFGAIAKRLGDGDEIAGNRKAVELAEKELAKLEPYRNTWHERIIREEIKQAAQDGKTKLQFPTGETAMKIERLGDNTVWSLDNATDAVPSELKVGKEIYRGSREVGTNEDDAWIITDVLGDGKFKAVPKSKWDTYSTDLEDKPIKSITERLRLFRASDARYEETFDISGKVDTNHGVYRRYEKLIGPYLKNKYNAKVVTDPQGVTWVEVDIKKEMKKLPIEAFGVGGLMLNDEE